MIEQDNTFFYKLRLVFVCALMLVSVLFLPIFLSAMLSNNTVQAKGNNADPNSITTGMDDSPNVITSGLSNTINGLNHTMASTQKSLNNVANSIDDGTKNITKTAAAATTTSGKFIAHSTVSSAAFVGKSIASGAEFTGHTTSNALGLIAHNPVVKVLTQPKDKTKIPVIDPTKITYTEYQSEKPVNSNIGKATTQPLVDSQAQWPIHGEITLEFGVPHWPYQEYHTGIDISDGARSGVTPVHPFKPGKVIQVIHSSAGLGNHVLIDHGGGITSVYGHMYSTAVQVGQQVDKNTTLGLEGTTGASTGPHVHLEIRVNNVPVNPHKYINGSP